MSLEDQLRDSLRRRADGAPMSGEGWERIAERVRTKPRRLVKPTWLIPGTVAAALAVAALITAVVVSRPRSRQRRVITQPGTSGPIPPSGRVAARLPLASPADVLAAGPAGLWAIQGNTLVHVDPASGRALSSVTAPPVAIGAASVSGHPAELAVGDRVVWMATEYYYHDPAQLPVERWTINEVDGPTGAIMRTIPIDPGFNIPALALQGDALWTAVNGGQTQSKIVEIDPSGKTVASHVVSGFPQALAVTPSGIWSVVNDTVVGQPSLVRFNPVTFQPNVRSPLTGYQPILLSDGNDVVAVAVIGPSTGQLTRIDPETGQPGPASTFNLPLAAPTWTLKGGSLWVTTKAIAGKAGIARVDATSGAIEGLPLELPGSRVVSITAAGAVLWVATDDASIIQVTPTDSSPTTGPDPSRP